jgi:altronate hydrolase
MHQTGCGEQRSDSESLARLLASYITHPNVAGATVLSLGCQNTEVELVQESLASIAPDFDRPVIFLEQQKIGSERTLLTEAVLRTFSGLTEANKLERSPAPLESLVMGVECGGSDGFSGLSANPAIGHAADLLVGLGGSVVLSEFPELCGVEQELIDRCTDDTTAERFIELQRAYARRAALEGSGFDMNPSPGNIRDGLITDAMKSAGAARKGGSSPVVDALDYTELVRRKGLSLLCTPGGDVESTTAMAGSGANVMVFSTGLGTPTGNAVAPVIKVASNTELAQRMPDIIDLDAGPIITGEKTIEAVGEEILEMVLAVASGETVPAAVHLRQDDFIPWKRGISL